MILDGDVPSSTSYRGYISQLIRFAVHTIIHDNLNMRRLYICARWIPKMLSECQKTQRMESCRRFVQRFQREGVDFLSRTVTADEPWIRLYDRQTVH